MELQKFCLSVLLFQLIALVLILGKPGGSGADFWWAIKTSLKGKTNRKNSEEKNIQMQYLQF